ncbi:MULTISPECIES: conjugal transfer protein TraD [Rickettsieae]|uniref:conjugal transfer protein TraD n=1 Tax=Rickettsieae TaxID=33988 RepID=UPI002024B415|nr:conjugal transfer protein TraD [Rickettsia endosymbiont of Oedothorax gibbosus]
MENVIKQRLKLQQKKAKIITEEAKIKIIERKMRTRRLIELGGLIAKAKLDDLPTNSLFGALVSLKNELTEFPHIKDQWTKIGRNIFDQELKDKPLLS